MKLSSAMIEAEARKLYAQIYRVRIEDLPEGITPEHARRFLEYLATPAPVEVFDRDVATHARVRAILNTEDDVIEAAQRLIASYIRGTFGAWLAAEGLICQAEFLSLMRNQIRVSWLTPISEEAKS